MPALCDEVDTEVVGVSDMTHLEVADMESVIRKLDGVTDAMAETLEPKLQEVDGLMGSQDWSQIADKLRTGLGEFSDSYAQLTQQAVGFGDDLRAVVTSWEETDTAHARVFDEYGEPE